MYLATLPLIKRLQIVDFFSFELHLAMKISSFAANSR